MLQSMLPSRGTKGLLLKIPLSEHLQRLTSDPRMSRREDEFLLESASSRYRTSLRLKGIQRKQFCRIFPAEGWQGPRCQVCWWQPRGCKTLTRAHPSPSAVDSRQMKRRQKLTLRFA